MGLALVTEDKSEWYRCRPWLEEMVSTSDFYNMAHIENRIEEGTLHFWSGKYSLALTEFLTFPLAKALNVFAVAGEKGNSLQELFNDIEPRLCFFARENGCKKIMGYGIRPEWKRACEAIGYSHKWTVMAKEI